MHDGQVQYAKAPFGHDFNKAPVADQLGLQRRKVLPYKNPEDFERFVGDLRKAGIPEG